MINFDRIDSISTKSPVSDDEINLVQTKLNKKFPLSYMRFLKQTDGFLSDPVSLYSVSNLIEMNDTYEVDIYCPEYIHIGNNGGGSAVLIMEANHNDSKVYFCDQGSMTADTMHIVGTDFIQWLESGCPRKYLTYVI